MVMCLAGPRHSLIWRLQADSSGFLSHMETMWAPVRKPLYEKEIRHRTVSAD